MRFCITATLTHFFLLGEPSQGRGRSYLLMSFLFACGSLQLLAQQAVVNSTMGSGQEAKVSLTLPAALQMALQHSRQIALAKLATAESHERRAMAKSHYYPQISNQSSASYLTDLQGVVIPAGAFSITNGLIPSEPIRIGQGAQAAYTSGTGLVQPITQTIKVHEGVKVAEADVKSSEITETEVKNTITVLVHKLYFDILVTEARLKSSEELLHAKEISGQETEGDISAGRSLELASLETHADLLDQQQTILTAQISIDDLTRQFDDLVGLPLETVVTLDVDSLGDLPQLPSRQDAIAVVMEKNTQVLLARQGVEKAKAALAAARAAYIPDVSGFARQSYQSGVPFLLHNFGTFGAMVNINLFDGGAREAAVKQARIQLSIAETTLTQAQANATIAISAAYDKIEQLNKLVTGASEAQKAREGIAQVSDQRLAQNAELASSVAKAHAAVDAAKASVLEARLGHFLAQRTAQEILGQLP